MPLTGHSIIAGQPTPGSDGTFRAVDPATAGEIGPEVTALTQTQLTDATKAAAQAFPQFRATSPDERATFLEAIADEIESLGDELVDTAHLESGLPLARLQGERGRTCGQLRMFAQVVRAGDHLGVRIDPALPDRTPLARPDLRQRMIALGPVAVFGASNFPLAFSTAGGDTASALAAGCPVVVKAHNAHPGTAELVGRAITVAADRTGMPAGVFSLVFGLGNEIGAALVSDPAIAAVGFTGSRAGGLALVAAAAARPAPIPVYAEMSSVNPVVVLPGSIEGDRARELATAFVGSLTLGSGQFCTNPGLLFLPAGEAGDRFVDGVEAAVRQTTGQTMLTGGIHDHFEAGTERLGTAGAVTTVAVGSEGEGQNAPAPVVFSTEIAQFVGDDSLAAEVFGAAGLIVRYEEIASLAAALGRLEGQLTATLHGTESDHDAARTLLAVLETRAGRVLWGGWPTGVEVSHAMVHGGPFPATSDSRTTSVGTLAIERFQRPVCYQDLPEDLLPEALRDDNPWGLVRRLDGALQLPASS
ncbi:2,5-dioxovalerate dehydrogenase [Humibacillus sp. DSM 29435]|uniref:aldehyde dehydrogenase (NADP(+)) n=1 Tax=Humibacillus sp. DSM 29435 TaxID=1869167 RepID=UPI000872BD6A|nr:aldehyde dehydrogenase (NADP(+)) [Humibacillus sp. DSM 29435]OFE15234.1 2,5-dioxovalerate dehydrogenase [Humibacillus sp. DSM 29435]